MTACVDNKEKKGGAAKAVSATLAGVLAVGMVPAVAFATPEGDSAEAEGDIELLVAQDQIGAFKAGKISTYKAGAGLTDSYVAGAETTGPVPTAVQPDGNGLAPVEIVGQWKTTTPTTELTAGSVYYAYIKLADSGNVGAVFTFADGKTVTGNWADDLSDPGEYALVAMNYNGTDFDYVKLAEKFTVAAEDLANAVVTFDDNKTAEPIVFNNSAYAFAGSGRNALHIFLNGVELFGGTDVTATIVDANTLQPILGQTVTYAGSYKVLLDGAAGSVYEQDTNNYIDLVIQPFDLGSASITLDNIEAVTAGANYTSTILHVNNGNDDWAKGLLQLGNYTPAPTATGKYTATVSVVSTASDAEKASITGTTTATYSVVEDKLADSELTFRYGDKDADAINAAGGIMIDYSADKFTVEPGKKSNSFDASKISLALASDPTDTFETSEYDLVVFDDETGKSGGIEMLNESGDYTLYAVLDSEALSFDYAGTSKGINVSVTQGEVADANVTFAYNGKAVTAIDDVQAKMTYNGEDQLGDITITVKTTTGVTVDPADYTVTVKKENVKNEYVEVDGIVGAGDYQVIVTSDKYDIIASSSIEDAEVLEVKVNQFKPEAIQIAGVLSIKDAVADPVDPAAGYFLPYTGAEITPVIEYKVTDAAGNEIWTTLPADQYEISRIAYSANLDATTAQKNVDAVKEIGKYWIFVEEAFASPAAGQNFDFANTKLEVRVSDAQVFYDVTTDAWYYDEVLTAANNGWIKGFNNGDFYMPNESIKRGDVCVILARMAGVTLDIDENGGISTKYYETPFDDVDGNLYYAEAIAWAANTGVVTGYDNTGDFCPEEPITREAFATMLSRYAANLGIDTTAGAGAADEYADADAVSWWAEDAVDWAVSADIMGVDTSVLAPTANISRAETAAMVVRL